MQKASIHINWKIGLRIREKGLLCDGGTFQIIKNPWWGWAADPFLFESDGIIYIFAEVWNFFLQRGTIGYCTISNGQASKWNVIIKERYHLSYPFIWKDEKGIHICAETCGKRNIYFYTAKKFPDNWEKEESKLTGRKYADSTMLFNKEGAIQYCFSYIVEGINIGRLCRYSVRGDMFDKNSEICITEDAEIARPGGAFFREKGVLYRVAQNCGESYGRSLIFLEVISAEAPYKEKRIKEVLFDDVKTDIEFKKIGMHTYNRSEHYEVVDFRTKQFNFLSMVCAYARGMGHELKEIIGIVLKGRV